jgi:hypothetical protein
MEDIRKQWNAIDVMSIVLMGDAERIMSMMNGFHLEGMEVSHFPRIMAMFLVEDGLAAEQPDDMLQKYVDKTIAQIIKNRESLKDTFAIPKLLLEAKYKGCGNGIVTIDKQTRKVLDFDYTDSKLRPIKKQNISMTKAAGKKIREDDATITYRANFSSCTVCLF